ncbi:alkane 1-monooxygenase [Pseudooctadecabacter jejudonensis]|uniref:Alkane 1-monooxygenase 2 n=1 Tax=Pseudooctadecabacter jejudonensis TaxID=1391910 RepID=A0A1Y5RT86_9RHOB|nr:alkane 1-monooxygenase [Pseudooctadecabacter jejudonensis]SLN22186.1 Alkane 1-monooxygenase 2 [Pseudooctadecabacter jejudonensis]
MTRILTIVPFAIVTLMAPTLIAAGAIWGGGWAVAGVIWMTALTASLDELVSVTLPHTDGDEFPSADGLSVLLALAHLALWVTVIAALGGATGLETWEKLVVFTGAGLFMGQVSNSNAHELIHRPGRGLRRAGRWVYISLLFGHHTSAHPLVHHVHVGTPADPSTARRGESFYRFFKRAWVGGFREGLRAENKRFPRLGRHAVFHPYVTYVGGAVLVLIAAATLGGWKGLLGAVCLAGFAQTQLMMSDYVQHYGLSRRQDASGKPEPVGVQHSWNAPHLMSSALMLNAPRHSDHHAHPARPFPSLRLEGSMPMLPRSLPVMACVALYPRLWRRVMDPLADEWQSAA